MTEARPCVFCNIVAGTEPAKIRYLDEDLIVIVNKLTWVPLMLLAMPKKHVSMVEMWSSGLMNRLGDIALDMPSDEIDLGRLQAPRFSGCSRESMV